MVSFISVFGALPFPRTARLHPPHHVADCFVTRLVLGGNSGFLDWQARRAGHPTSQPLPLIYGCRNPAPFPLGPALNTTLPVLPESNFDSTKRFPIVGVGEWQCDERCAQSQRCQRLCNLSKILSKEFQRRTPPRAGLHGRRSIRAGRAPTLSAVSHPAPDLKTVRPGTCAWVRAQAWIVKTNSSPRLRLSHKQSRPLLKKRSPFTVYNAATTCAAAPAGGGASQQRLRQNQRCRRHLRHPPHIECDPPDIIFDRGSPLPDRSHTPPKFPIHISICCW